MAKNDDLEEMLRQIDQTMTLVKPIKIPREPTFMETHNQIMANSAREMSWASEEIEEQMQEIAERNERRDAAIQRTAQESVEHTRLLEKQLQEVQTQNELLRAEAAASRAEIESSRKSHKRTRIFSIITTAISIAIAVASLIVAICN